MATQHNFRIKNGLEVAGSERISSSGAMTPQSLTVAADAGIGGNLVVTGNLTVNGTTTTLSTTTLDVEDKNITLNKGSGDTSGSANGAGITIQDAVDASTDATLLWDNTNDRFDFSHTITTPTLITGAYGASGSAGDGFRINSTDIYGQTDASDKIHLSAVSGNATFAGALSSGGHTLTSGNLQINDDEGKIRFASSLNWDIQPETDDASLRIKTSSGASRTVYFQNTGNGNLNVNIDGTITSGAITSSGEIRGNSLKAHVGTDTGTQLVLFANASGHCFVAGHTLSFNVGANNSRTTQFALDSNGNATFSQNVAVGGDISLTGGGTIEAPSTSGGENLLLNAAGGIHLRIDSNGNSGDDQVFKVMKHTSALLFSVQENGYAYVDKNLEVGGHFDCSGTGSRVSARVQDMFHIGSENNGAATTRYGNSSTRTYTDGGSSGYQGYVWGQENWFPSCFIPYSPNQVFRLSASIYQLTGSTATGGASSRHYLGVAGYDENFNFLSVDGIGTYQYILASNNVVSTGNFLEVDVTLKGWQGSGGTNGNKMDEGTVYIRPLWLANYQSSGGTAVLTGFTIMPAGTVADDNSNAGTAY